MANQIPSSSNSSHQDGGFGYQAYISPVSNEDPNVVGGYAASYGYYTCSSKYAPEEPGVMNADSFSGYAPAPSSAVPYGPQNNYTAVTAPLGNAIDVFATGDGSSLQGYKSVSESSLSQTSSASVTSESRTCADSETAYVSENTKTSTAKKIKTLPLPKVGLPLRPCKSKSEQFKEYVGEVARLNEEIERLQKLQEQLRQEAKRIVGASSDDALPIETQRECPSFEEAIGAIPSRSSSKHSIEKHQVAEYIPTPLAELERLKREEKKRNKKKEKEKELAEQLKEKTKKSPSKRLHEDDIHFLFEDDTAPKSKKSKGEETLPKYVRDHPRKRSSPPLSNSRPSTSAIPKSSKIPQREESLVGVSASDCSSPKAAVDIKADSPECAGDVKKRIAREGVQERAVKLACSVPRKAPSAKEQLNARMCAIAKEKSTSPTLSNTKPITLEQMYGHRRPNVVGSIAKGESRHARTTSLFGSETGATPKLRDPTNSKIPYSIRVSFLSKIFSQYLEVCPEAEALRNSELEEKAIVDKVRHVQGYKVAAINLIGRIRNAKSTGSGKSRAALSHDAVLAGRHVKDISIRVRKTEKQSVSSLSEKDFYNLLIEKYLMTDEQLTRNGYPRAVPGDDQLVTIERSHFEKSKAQKSWAARDDLERLCSRCHKEFRLDPKGNIVHAECVYHYKGLQRRGGLRGESFYSCCGSDRTTTGCCVAEAHVSDTLNAEALREFTPTPASRGDSDPRNERVYAMDCEMVYGVWGPELARVSVVDMHNELVLDLIVKPRNMVIDYNTRFSGLTANQVEASTADIFEAQNRLFELVNEQSILIGHSLESDLKAMRLRHERVVDTAVVFEHRQGFPFKRALRNLASEYLQKIIQEDDSGHDSQEDAATCMSLMLMKAREVCK